VAREASTSSFKDVFIAPQHCMMATPYTVSAKAWVPCHQRRPQCGGRMFKLAAQSCLNCWIWLRVFCNFRTSAGRGPCLWRPVPFGARPGHPWGLGVCHRFSDRTQGAGGRGTATGDPPQMGTSGSQRRAFRRTRAEAGGVPAAGGRGGLLVPQVARFAVSALRGWSGEPHKSVEIR
jgi:hypothetical protein